MHGYRHDRIRIGATAAWLEHGRIAYDAPWPEIRRWARDELILAMDLYVRHGPLRRTDPLVVELSAILKALPIHPGAA